MPVEKKTDGCGNDFFAIAFAAEILDRTGTFWCGQNSRAFDQLFGKWSSHTIPESLIPFKYIKNCHWKVFFKTGSVPQVFCRKKTQTVVHEL